MLCPKCNQEMISGYLKPTGPGGIGWTPNHKEGYFDKYDPDYVKIGEAPLFKSGAIPSFKCDDCQIIVLEYTNSETH